MVGIVIVVVAKNTAVINTAERGMDVGKIIFHDLTLGILPNLFSELSATSGQDVGCLTAPTKIPAARLKMQPGRKPITLHADVRPATAAKPEREARRDSEYEHRGTANAFLAVEPKAGKHFCFPTPDRTGFQFALAEQRRPPGSAGESREPPSTRKGENPMDENESLSHTNWDFKYHVVFIPKCRRKVLYGQLRRNLGEVFRRLAGQQECRIEEGHLMIDHVHMMIAIPPK